MTALPDESAQPPKPPHAPQPAGPTFESALADLAELVGRLESGTLGLSESIAAYEKGVSLLHGLHEQLAAVEERVRTLVRVDEQGRPILTATAPGTAGAEKSAGADAPAGADKPARGTARAGRAKRLPGMDDAEGPT
jgi:exodeoxyribonuclease VII small subunit